MIQAIFAFVALGFAAGEDPKEASKRVLERLQGEWKMESGRVNGVDSMIDPMHVMKCSVTGNKVSFTRDDKVVEEVTIKLDALKIPAEVDSTLVVNHRIAPGIYQLDGDSFTLCYSHPGTPRPTDFKAKAGSGHKLSVWKRIKK